MFGNKKNKKKEEQNKAILTQYTEKRESFEADVTHLKEAGKRIHEDVSQVVENTNHLVEHASINIEEEVKLVHIMDDFAKDVKVAMKEYELLRNMVSSQMEATTALVEENKHYTSPAKYLSETPGTMRTAATAYVEKLKELEEDSRKISSLARSNMMEARDKGETAKAFFVASEAMEQAAMEMETKAGSIREELEQSQARIAELEEIVGRLVALMKDNNIGTTRLLKKCQEANKAIEASSMRDFSLDVDEMRDKVVGLRNLDEEIAKCGERNKLQLGDIQEDFASQKKQLAELDSDISYILDLLEEQSC